MRTENGETIPSRKTAQEQHERGDERARLLVETHRREAPRDRVGHPCQEQDEHGRSEADDAEPCHGGRAIGELTADPVTRRERREEDGDEAPPHEDGVAEMRREQPRACNLERHEDRTGHEDQCLEAQQSPRCWSAAISRVMSCHAE